MKTRLPVIAIAALAATFPAAAAQSQSAGQPPKAAAKKHMPEHEMSPWKEMNSFHDILAATYHPSADDGNLKPLREKADALAAKAREWSASTAPAACASDSLRTTVGAISMDAVAIANQVLAQASDVDLKKAIAALHDKFQTVERSCRGPGMKHQD
jgi:hypothetical protein